VRIALLVLMIGCSRPAASDGDATADADRPNHDVALPPDGYSAERVMAQPVDGADLDSIAAAHGTTARPVGPSGWGAIDVPAQTSVDELLEALRADPDVASAAAIAIAEGASHGGEPARANALQWHLDAIDAPQAGTFDVSDLTVAVLSSGVAYENYSDASGDYIQAPSLAGVPIRSPWDFVDDDAHPNDDYQHGTFMASVIASQGSVEGVAAGVGLMPIKVLDHTNRGDELWLVDGLWYAVDHGADVINLSLSFRDNYVPSRALQQALAHAADAGVVVIAAAGNDGHMAVSWPAASPLAIAVGASQLVPAGPSRLADYSNRSPKVEVVAPGGDLTADANHDGYVDGIVAETIDRNDPTHVGLWMFAGTSGATAMVSGAAVHLLAAGADPSEVSSLLASGARPFPGGTASNAGAGLVQVGRSLSKVGHGHTSADAYGVAMMSYLQKDGDNIVPTATLTVVDGSGQPASGKTVLGTIWGEGGGAFECRANQCGQCTVTGPATPSADATGAKRALAWVFRAEAVRDGNAMSRPTAALFADEKLEIVTAGMQLDPRVADAVLAFSWSEVDDPDLGSLAAGTTVVDLASGYPTAAMSVVYTDAARIGATQAYDVDLEGSGLASIPVGTAGFTGIIVHTPLTNMKLAAIDGTGVSTQLLGFKAADLFRGTNERGQCSKTATLMADGVLPDGAGTLPGDWTSGVLADGGWVNRDGYPGASLVGAVVNADPAEGSEGVSLPGSIPVQE
jgi:hypothetical protein